MENYFEMHMTPGGEVLPLADDLQAGRQVPGRKLADHRRRHFIAEDGRFRVAQQEVL